MSKLNSVRYRMVFLFCAVVFPLTVILIGYFTYSITQLRNKFIDSNQNLLTYYGNQLDMQLNNTTNYMLSLTISNELTADLNSPNPNSRLLAAISLAQQWTQNLSLYNTDYYFIYTPKYQEYLHQYNNAALDYNTAADIKNYLLNHMDNLDSSHQWQLTTIEGSDYLLFTYRTTHYCLGAVISIDTLLSSLSLLETQDDTSYFITDMNYNSCRTADLAAEQIILSSNPEDSYSLTGKAHQYIELSCHSATDSFILWEIIPNTNIFGMLDHTLFFLLGLAVFLLCMVLLSIYLIYRWILIPLHILRTAILSLKEGDMEYRIQPLSTSCEFAELNTAFNDMSSEIKQLKIQVYEETIRKQQAELNFLQMQIRPHFFLNALTTISNFSHLGQLENQRKFLLYLGSFIRYSFQKSINMVPVWEEIDNITNYISMQNLQHDNSILFIPTLSPDVETEHIPPFSLLTFVENSIKHGLIQNPCLTILINASYTEDGMIQLLIEDNGSPFDQEYLDAFHNGNCFDESTPYHVGIRNIHQTIHLLYHEKGKLLIDNSELGGGKISMTLPPLATIQF